MKYIKAVLQGRPLGTPLHVIIVHFPIGLFLLAVLFDLWSLLFDGGNEAVRAAFAAIIFGIIMGGVAAIPGLADWWDIRRDHPARRTATIHMILNLTAVALFVLSFLFRIGEREAEETPTLPFVLALIGFGVVSVSGYLGGRLVYVLGIGVGRHRRSMDAPSPTHTINVTAPDATREYVPVAAEREIGEGETLRVDLDGTIVAIVRAGATLYAVQEFCTHRFGPLSEGKISDCEIECPWHRSRFDLRTGKVTNGPAKIDLRTFDVIGLNGTIYLRPRRPERPAWKAPDVLEGPVADDLWQSIQPGDELVAENGIPAGQVVAVLDDQLAVRSGEFRPTVSYVPRGAVTGRDGARVRVDLSTDEVHYRWG